MSIATTLGIGNNKSMVIQVNKNQCGGTVGVNNQDLSSDVKVPTTTLDTVFWDDIAKSPRTKIAVMKIDIEGAEPAAMQGASQLLKSHVVLNLIMEVNCHNNCLDTAVLMFQQLRICAVSTVPLGVQRRPSSGNSCQLCASQRHRSSPLPRHQGRAAPTGLEGGHHGHRPGSLSTKRHGSNSCECVVCVE